MYLQVQTQSQFIEIVKKLLLFQAVGPASCLFYLYTHITIIILLLQAVGHDCKTHITLQYFCFRKWGMIVNLIVQCNCNCNVLFGHLYLYELC